MIHQNLISIFTFFPSWENSIHHSIASISNRLLTWQTVSSESRELWGLVTKCTAWLEDLLEPGTSFPVVCSYWAADSAWGQLASLVVYNVSHAGYPFKISFSCHWSSLRKRKSCERK